MRSQLLCFVVSTDHHCRCHHSQWLLPTCVTEVSCCSHSRAAENPAFDSNARAVPKVVGRSAGPFGRAVVVVVVGRSCRAVGRLIGRRRRQPSPSIGRSVRRLVGRVSSSVAAVDRGSVFDLRNHAESASTPSISPTWQPENFALGFRPA